jgi:hypothetical protein
MAADPAALQLRLLQTVVEVAAEKNSTLVMPFPVELLRFFDRVAPPVPQAGQARTPPDATRDAHAPPPAQPTLAAPVLSVRNGLPPTAAPLNEAQEPAAAR